MEQFVNTEKEKYRGASMGVFDPGQDAKRIFGEIHDKTFYATSCAYLLRRFGPAQRGCDPYKDLTWYVLTTQMEGVLLTVRPCCSVSTSFGYMLSPEIYESTMKAECDSRQKGEWVEAKDCEIRSPIAKVLCDAMKELKEPVNVRDWYFNIVGRIKDCDLKIDDEGDSVVCVEYSKLAGYGIAPEYFDKFKE